MEVNFFGPLGLVRAFAPHLARHRGGILFVQSLAALVISRSSPIYSASKAAAMMLAAGVRAELRPDGVTVTSTFPGFIDTDMTTGLESPESVTPLGRRPIPRRLRGWPADRFPDRLAGWSRTPSRRTWPQCWMTRRPSRPDSFVHSGLTPPGELSVDRLRGGSGTVDRRSPRAIDAGRYRGPNPDLRLSVPYTLSQPTYSSALTSPSQTVSPPAVTARWTSDVSKRRRASAAHRPEPGSLDPGSAPPDARPRTGSSPGPARHKGPVLWCGDASACGLLVGSGCGRPAARPMSQQPRSAPATLRASHVPPSSFPSSRPRTVYRVHMCYSESGVCSLIVSGCYPPPGLDQVSHGDRGRDGKKSQRSDDADAECVGVAAPAEGSEERWRR